MEPRVHKGRRVSNSPIVSAASPRTLLALICEELLFLQISERRRGGGGGDKEREDKGTYKYSACTCMCLLWWVFMGNLLQYRKRRNFSTGLNFIL